MYVFYSCVYTFIQQASGIVRLWPIWTLISVTQFEDKEQDFVYMISLLFNVYVYILYVYAYKLHMDYNIIYQAWYAYGPIFISS